MSRWIVGVIAGLLAAGCGGPTGSSGSAAPPGSVVDLDSFAVAQDVTSDAPGDEAAQPDTPGLAPDPGPEAAPDLPVELPAPEPRAIPQPTSSSSNGRVVAIGDLHGDYWSALEALQVAGVADAEGNWIGGDTIMVQVGDQLDRGDDERAIIHMLEALADGAHEAGGAAHILLGNHEIMNVELDLRYVTEGGYADFADIPYDPADPLIASYPEEERGRVAAFRPGGPYAMILAGHNVSVIVDDTVFVHGGILPEAALYGLDVVNSEVQAWMRGEASDPDIMHDMVWTRIYSDDDEPGQPDCVTLAETLGILGVARMVVAHTVQSNGITSSCNGQVWRIDVGIADYYGGTAQVLQIVGDQVTVVE